MEIKFVDLFDPYTSDDGLFRILACFTQIQSLIKDLDDSGPLLPPRYICNGTLIGLRADEESALRYTRYWINNLECLKFILTVRDRFLEMKELFLTKQEAQNFRKGLAILGDMGLKPDRLEWFYDKAIDFEQSSN